MSITFITPTLGRSTYLGETIASVLSHMLDGDEYIIVCPPDQIPSLSSRFPESRLRFVPERGRRGIYGALNDGLAEARGQGVSYINDDDMLMEGFSKVRASFARCMDAICYGRVSYLAANGSEMFEMPVARSSRTLDVMRMGVNPYTQQGTIYPMAVFSAYRAFDLNYRLCSDFALICEAVAAGHRHVFSNEIAAGFRIHAGQLSQDTAAITGEVARITRDFSAARRGLLWRFRWENRLAYARRLASGYFRPTSFYFHGTP